MCTVNCVSRICKFPPSGQSSFCMRHSCQFELSRSQPHPNLSLVARRPESYEVRLAVMVQKTDPRPSCQHSGHLQGICFTVPGCSVHTADANQAQKAYADSLTRAMLEQQQCIIYSLVAVVGTAVTEDMTSDLDHVHLPAQRQVVSTTLRLHLSQTTMDLNMLHMRKASTLLTGSPNAFEESRKHPTFPLTQQVGFIPQRFCLL